MQNQRHHPGRFLIPVVASIAIAILASSAVAETKASASAELFPAEQLEQLVAPIALYPDALIAQILMASTYPLDVVQANRWLGEHEDLKETALDDAVRKESWDDSVKALVFFPSVLEFMSDNLDWTQDLGDAVLAQQGEVTDTIQRLRAEADQAGTLASTEQQRVEKAGETIIIQPAQPEVVYVPTYDPVKVYGDTSPPATAYYPNAYADASASYEAGYAAGQSADAGSGGVSSDSLIGFGVGALAGGLLTAAIMWDDDDDWNDRLYYGGRGYYGAPSYWGQPNYWNNNGWRQPANINVDRTRNMDIDRTVERGDINVNRGIVGNDVTKWEHNPERRGGVRYRDSSTENRFAAKRGEANINRDEARGRLKGGGNRQVKAPDLGAVTREGTASGGLSKLAENRGDGNLGDLKDRAGAGQVKAPALDQVRREGAASGKVADLADKRPAGGEARAKVQAKAPAVKAKPKPKVQAAAATKRPVNREAIRPAATAVKRPAASAPKVQRPAAAPKASAFKASKPAASRAASQRGGASRAVAQRGGGGGKAARSGGGGLRR